MPAKVNFVDLSQPLQPLYVDARYERLFMVVSWGYRPIAFVQLPNRPPHLFEPQRLKSELLSIVGWRLWELNLGEPLDDLRHSQPELPPISVVVCTRDRAVTLARCLNALEQVDYPLFEVVVVDNASVTGDTARAVSKYNARYVREERPGLDWARNRGIKESIYNLIAFIDDDAYATPGWLRGVAHAFANTDVMAVTGMVLPAELETQAQIDFEAYGGMSKGLEPFTIEWTNLEGPGRFWASSWGIGANMAFRRQVFDEVGLFNPGLDVGTATRGGGDLEFLFRVVAEGFTLRYEPAALVRHVHRRVESGLLEQIQDNGQAFPAFLLAAAQRYPFLRRDILWFATRWWLGPWLLKRMFSRDATTRRWARAELRGSFRALPGYARARRDLAALSPQDSG